ncbi:sulfatase-like hydrolase/transferase [Chelativorans sp.]|uniref:sulfatase-like hydrolase/transferase n=1 Tax=Chelativorans sp. TaxID=2203393 RepID=UPI002811F406|nr:sulfatase-like hydrolase/transferase [Chelativorans sp.]
MQRLIPVLAAILLPGLVFLSFSPAVIQANANEIAFTARALYAVWALFLASSAVLAVIALACRSSVVFLTSFAINVIAWNAAYPHIWLHSPIAMLGAVAAEVALLAICTWIALRVPFDVLAKAAALFAVLTVAFSIPQHYALWHVLKGKTEGPPRPELVRAAPTSASAAKFQGNVYHVVLDAFASPYFKYRLNSKNKPELNGFTFFPNAIANYGRTNLSMRSVFTGQHHPSPITNWDEAFNKGFSASLQSAGISTHYFPFYPYFCDPEASLCEATTVLYAANRKNLGTTFAVDILFQSLIPVSVRDYFLGSLQHQQRPVDTWEYGFSLTSSVRGLFDGSEGFPKWRQPMQAATMDTLEQFLEAEQSLPPRGRYVFLHLMVPHSPFVFDASCSFAHPDRQAQKSHDQQIDDQFACAVTVMERITEQLRELNRFENSLVIFHADHGLGDAALLHRWDSTVKRDPSAPYIDRDTGDLSKLPSHFVEGVAGALLLIHPPGAKESKISDAPAQLLDIAPTVMDFFGLAYTGPGVSLLSVEPPADRPAIYFEAHTAELGNIDRFAKFLREKDGWKFQGWEAQQPATNQAQAPAK